MKKIAIIFCIATIAISCSSSQKKTSVNKETYIIGKYAQTLGVQKKNDH